MRSGTELSQFSRLFLPPLKSDISKTFCQYLIVDCTKPKNSGLSGSVVLYELNIVINCFLWSFMKLRYPRGCRKRLPPPKKKKKKKNHCWPSKGGSSVFGSLVISDMACCYL